MADIYSTRPELKSFLGIPENDGTDDMLLELSLEAASRWIDDYCGRRFYSTASSTRVFRALAGRLQIDDAQTVTLVEQNTTGTYVTRAATTYETGPPNGVHNGLTGWPITYLNALGGTWWPTSDGLVRVTAVWGWTTVPVPISQACLLIAAERFKLKDAPFGVAGFGDYTIRVRDNPIALGLLDPYRRTRLPKFA